MFDGIFRTYSGMPSGGYGCLSFVYLLIFCPLICGGHGIYLFDCHLLEEMEQVVVASHQVPRALLLCKLL